LCWCLGLSAFFIQVSTSNAAAAMYASSSEGTLPLGALLAVTTLSAPVVPRLEQRFGLRRVYLGAVIMAAVGAALNIVAAFEHSFGLLVVGALLQGTIYTCTNHLRFAALRFVLPESHSNTIALVLAGGAVSAVLGPELARATRTSLDEPFAGSYVVALALYAAYFITILWIDFDSPPREQRVSDESADSNAKDEEAVSRFDTDRVGVHISVEGANPTDEATSPRVLASTHTPPISVAAKHASGAAAIVEAAQSGGPSPSHPSPRGSPGAPRKASPKTISPHPRGLSATTSRLSLQAPTFPHRAALPYGLAEEPPRSLRSMCCQLNFITALIVAAVSYSAMASTMSATPLAMRKDGHTFSEQTLTIELHILGMFLPSLISGGMVSLFMPLSVALLGLVIIVAGNLFFLLGNTVSNYNLGIISVGLGWNFAFVASTKLVASQCSPAERPRLVALNEFVVLGSLSVLVFAASYSLDEFGFEYFSLLHAAYVLLAAVFVKSVMWYQACHPTPESLMRVGLVSSLGSHFASAAASETASLASAPMGVDRRSRSVSSGAMSGPGNRLLQLKLQDGGNRLRSTSHSALMGGARKLKAGADFPGSAAAAAAKIRAERAQARAGIAAPAAAASGWHSPASGPATATPRSSSGLGFAVESASNTAGTDGTSGHRRRPSNLRRETVSKTTLTLTPSGLRMDSVV
jgi:hypothetical protein